MVKIIHIERIEAESKTGAISKAKRKKFITRQFNGVNFFLNIVLVRIKPSKKGGIFFAEYRKSNK